MFFLRIILRQWAILRMIWKTLRSHSRVFFELIASKSKISNSKNSKQHIPATPILRNLPPSNILPTEPSSKVISAEPAIDFLVATPIQNPKTQPISDWQIVPLFSNSKHSNLKNKDFSPQSFEWDKERILDTGLAHEKAILELLSFLGKLKGPIVKIAQMAAMIPGLLPESYSTALLSLCADAPPMHWPLLWRTLAQELGSDWQNDFLYFEKKSVAAASLGQVHRARYADGTEVAVKIQYPAMKQAVQADIGLFKTIIKLLGSSEKSLNLSAFPGEWETRLLEELDYVQEAKNMQRWSKLLHNQEQIALAQVIPNLCTAKVLVMTWLESKSMHEAFEQSDAVRNRIGKDLFFAWYHPFYRAGILHGDPHMGNVGWSDTGIVLYDFGCVRVFSPIFVQAFCDLYQGLLTCNTAQTLLAYQNLGFYPLSEPIVHALNQWARFLLAPFLLDQVCYLQEVSLPEKAQENLNLLYAALKAHGGTQPPAEFLIFDRVVVVLGALLIRLRVKANWYQWMQELVNSFSLADCVEHQREFLGDSN